MGNDEMVTQEQLLVTLGELRQRIAALEESHAKLRRQRDELREETARQEQTIQTLNYHFQNSLVPVVGLLYMKRRKIQAKPPTDCKEMLAGLISQVSVTSVVHRLYADFGWGDIPLTTLAYRVIRETLQTTPTPAPIAVEVEESPVHVTADQAKNLALILNELTLNTIAYACAGPGCHIVITLEKSSEWMRLEFHDNGPGYPETALSLKNEESLYLVRMLTQSLPEGMFSLYNKRGAVSVLRFKIREKAEK